MDYLQADGTSLEKDAIESIAAKDPSNQDVYLGAGADLGLALRTLMAGTEARWPSGSWSRGIPRRNSARAT